MCGDYYIGGRQFDSLAELVGFYSHCSDLLKRERLVEPVPPPEPVNDKKVKSRYVTKIILFVTFFVNFILFNPYFFIKNVFVDVNIEINLSLL